MNKDVLLEAQRRFLDRYPGGFDHPEMAAMAKKFKMTQHGDFARERFARDQFSEPHAIIDAAATLVSRSTLVSMFEKPKFKAVVAGLSEVETEDWAAAWFEFLHGDQQEGFVALVASLARHQLARWTLVTVVPAYYAQQTEVFVKPSTAKLIVNRLELGLAYHPTPSWEFYAAFRQALLAMRAIASDTNAPSNAAFSGILMNYLDAG
ncbi:hypothetical protein PSQ90_07285 [Devosia rhodophyticola]|uniref:Uncharacterized protein n=1 Tax=Devosia rhodophyticola TaxID=3026423 RepID=A0ABY7Z0N6_9HYPH|nr:hypothetical protein [Devosia rhodophyticola]WDR07220.1 hypothetical protein PSQ90_07285 [Devosia rhodophyticola]